MKSGWVILIGILAMTYASFVYYPKWKMTRTEATISWDVSGYYLYLPAAFIYHDLKKLEFKKSIDERYYPSSSPYQSFTHTSGHQVMKYTSGLAILYLPFFLLAHALALFLNLEADGYQPIYQLFISVSSIVYALIGLIILRRILLRYYSDAVSALSLGVIILCTNYFDYASITGAMAHNYLFTLYAVLILCADNYYEKCSPRWLYVAAVTLGMMVLIRPTEIIGGVLFVSWGAATWSDLWGRVKSMLSSFKVVFPAACFFMIFPGIQLLYWKYVAGEWIVYSYQEQGFSWLEGHHILQGLFSYRAGWLVYTPVMILMFPGIYYLWKHSRLALSVILFVLISLYLTFAWDEWTYGGSLSQRALVQHYPVMVFAVAAVVESILHRRWNTWALGVFLVLCMYYNLWLTHHAHRGGLYIAGMMNKTYFWHSLLKTQNSPELTKLLDTNEPPIPFDYTKSQELYSKDWDSLQCVQANDQISLWNQPISKGKIKIQLDVTAGQKEWDVWRMTQLVAKYTKGNEVVKTVFIRLHRLLETNETKTIDLVTTHPTIPYDSLQLFVWNPGGQPLCFNTFKLYLQP